MSHPVQFETPFNWCDRLCERCPLRRECKLALLDATRNPAPRDLAPTEPEPEPDAFRDPAPPEHEQVEALSRELFFALHRAHIEPPACTLVPLKLPRATSHEPGTESFLHDGAPTMLLVEVLMKELAEALQEHPEATEARELFTRVSALLPRFSAAVPDEYRAALHELISSGRAPSPFCVVAPDSP
jgi:hypothetical protein